jgi:ATP-dependent helicase Lhr and Lhr-like helicase
VNAFDTLHPALRYHIVNTLRWASMRPTQLEAIAPVLAGEDVLLLAPTAGGKTEAGLFPLLSRMLTEGWRGLAILYVCPLRALLNNLEPRIHRYASLAGLDAELWHGDVGDAARRRLLRNPPHILLTTPESLEAILISRRVHHRALFAELRAVVVDELHAFAGDDRGGICLRSSSDCSDSPVAACSASAYPPRSVIRTSSSLGWRAATCPEASLAPPGRLPTLTSPSTSWAPSTTP